MKNCFIFCLILFCPYLGFSQNDEGFFYQTVIRDSNGTPISNQQMTLKVSFRSSNSPAVLFWEEEHYLLSDDFGRVYAILGQGFSTGNGTLNDFRLIPWLDSDIRIHFEIDTTGTNIFIYLGSSSLLSHPFSLFSDTTLSLDPLPLINSLNGNSLNFPIVSQILSFDGFVFVPKSENNPDTVQFSNFTNYSFNSGYSNYVLNHIIDDVSFAFKSDTNLFSYVSYTSDSSELSIFSDTAIYASYLAPARWSLGGNSSMYNYGLGTNDSLKISFKVNNIDRLTFHPDGTITQGGIAPVGGYMLQVNNGFLLQGTLGAGTHPNGVNSRLVWSSNRSSFRAGSSDFITWDSLNTGLYSMAFGENNRAGNYSFAAGFENDASGDNAISFGSANKSLAIGVAGAGTSFTMGDSCIATGIRTICIGRNNRCGNTTAVAFGNNSFALGNVTTSLGNYVTAQGNISTAIGYSVSSGLRSGGFIWGDASTDTPSVPTANNMLLLRADGGVVFYTDMANSMGVTLFPGSGSWSSISDRNVKENFFNCDAENILMLTRNVPVYYWSYKSQRNVIHIGPMAQNIFEVFRFGNSETNITNSDFDGLIFVCVQGLYSRITLFDQVFDESNIESRIETLDQFQMNQQSRINLILDKIELNH